MRCGAIGRGLIAGVIGLASGCGGQTGVGVVREPPSTSKDGGSDGSDAGPEDGGAEAGDADAGPLRLTIPPFAQPGFFSIHDTEKNVDCVPTPAADGTVRCLPQGDVWYSDKDCKHPILLNSAPTSMVPPATTDPCGRPLPSYATDNFGPAGCLDLKARMYEAGVRVDTPAIVYTHAAAVCWPQNAPDQPPQGEYYEAVPRGLADWVELKEEVVPVTDALAVVYWKGADGSRFPKELRLVPSNRACEPLATLEGYAPILESPSRCVPTPVQSTFNGYPDDQCSGSELVATCKPADIVFSDNTLYTVGKPVSPVYFDNLLTGNVCSQLLLTPADYSTYAPLGGPLITDDYPELTVGQQGTGRVRTQYVASEGKPIYPTTFYDTKLAARCSAMKLSDGVTWCVPDMASVHDVPGGIGFAPSEYADVKCTRPLVSSVAIGQYPSVMSSYVLVLPRGTECDTSLAPSVHSLVEHKGQVYSWGSRTGVPPDGCLLESANPSAKFFEVGAEVDPSQVFGAVPRP